MIWICGIAKVNMLVVVSARLVCQLGGNVYIGKEWFNSTPGPHVHSRKAAEHVLMCS